MRATTTSQASFTLPPMWGGWVLLTVGLLAISPVLAQDGVNLRKTGEAAASGIKEGVEGGNSAQAAQGAMAAESEPATPRAADPAATPAAPPPPADPGAKYDSFHAAKRKLTPEENKAIMERAMAYIKYHLSPNETDVRQMTSFAGGRVPWASRAPRTNPFDPQIVKPLPFHQLILDSTPPPPYYPPAGGLKMQSLQEAFQRFLDTSKLSGIVTTDAGRVALISFGKKKTVRLRVGGEHQEKDYVIVVKDITNDAVVVKAADSELSGVLTLDSSKNLLVDAGERGLVIVSEEDEKNRN